MSAVRWCLPHQQSPVTGRPVSIAGINHALRKKRALHCAPAAVRFLPPPGRAGAPDILFRPSTAVRTKLARSQQPGAKGMSLRLQQMHHLAEAIRSTRSPRGSDASADSSRFRDLSESDRRGSLGSFREPSHRIGGSVPAHLQRRPVHWASAYLCDPTTTRGADQEIILASRAQHWHVELGPSSR